MTLKIVASMMRQLPANAVGFQELGGHGVFQLPDYGDGTFAGIRNLRTAAEELERGGQRPVVAVQPHKEVDRITARGVVHQVLAGHTGLRGAALGLPVQAGQVYGVVLVQGGGGKILVTLVQGYQQGVGFLLREMQHADAFLGGLVKSVAAEGGLDLVVGIVAVQLQRLG